jgi:UDP-glucose 4-epimerase
MRKSLEGQVVVVTGGAGFIGSHLSDSLLSAGVAELIIIDNMFLGSENNIADACKDKRVHFYKEDIEFKSSLDYIFEKHSVDTVFNCATKALNYSFMNPSNALSTNVTGVLNFLELQRNGKFKTLCHFSTSEVYGTAVYEPMDEKHPKNPTTTYAAGKAAADLSVESYVRMFDVDAFIVRPFNNYGPRQNHKGLLAGVIPITAFRIMSGGTPEIHGTGEQSRDFIHVHDTVDAVLKLYSVLPSGESVNISTDGQITINQLVPQICKLMGYQGDIVRHPERKSDVECHNASNKKLYDLIKVNLRPFDIGLADTINWYKENIKVMS